jgi:pyrroloquinoline quinone (PQQ) biosynthesis protein C
MCNNVHSVRANLAAIYWKMIETSAIEELELRAKEHSAVNHPYLEQLSAGFPNNPNKAIAYFASQYAHYSAWFPKYLNAVIVKLSDPQHKEHLLENLREEAGQLNEEEQQALQELNIDLDWVLGVAHPVLFDRFRSTICKNYSWEMQNAVHSWRTNFLNYLESCSEIEAVGAIGLGTESIVKHFYKSIISSIEKHTQLTLEDYVFFPLHTEVDDEHGKTLLRIAEELVKKNETGMLNLKKGMETALDLRAKFWNELHLETSHFLA